MRVIEPQQLRHLKPKKNRRKAIKSLFLLLLIAAIAAAGYAYKLYSRPLPALRPTYAKLPQPAVPPKTDLVWPDYGQAAIGAQGMNVLGSVRNTAPVPIASVAKIVTAIAVLKKYPLEPHQQGPTITITDDDINFYNQYVTIDGSVVPVTVGEKITEYQALQAMLLPSANNMAETLARWAYGSVDTYVGSANDMVANLGLSQTHIDDASGFSPTTTSTAHDVVLLGEIALGYPVIAQIVAQPSAVIPVAGEIHNVNLLLGHSGINGLKTGNTDEAGGCFLFSADYTVPGGPKVTIVGAVLGAPTLGAAMRDADQLLRSAQQSFAVVTTVKANQTIGFYKVPWGGTVKAVARDDVSVLTWQGSAVTVQAELDNVNGAPAAGSTIGDITAASPIDKTNVPVRLVQSIPAPSWHWHWRRR